MTGQAERRKSFTHVSDWQKVDEERHLTERAVIQMRIFIRHYITYIMFAFNVLFGLWEQFNGKLPRFSMMVFNKDMYMNIRRFRR